jgi:shikimate kinase
MMSNNSFRNVILIGMPAVGKSTVGVLLAKRLGFAFIDTDIIIQTREGRRLQNIIDDKGMGAFCHKEEQHILTLDTDAHVIATGGSVVYGAKAMAHLKALGIIVHMDLNPYKLQKRLSNLSSRGVVMTPGQDLSSLYRERNPLYLRYADLTIDCDSLSADQITSFIERSVS